MMKFGSEDCMTADDFLPKNNEETPKGVINDTSSNMETEQFNKNTAENTSNNVVSEDNFDYEFGVSEEEQEFRFREAIRLAKEKSRIMGKTTCEYDREKGKPYLLYPDGHKEYPTPD